MNSVQPLLGYHAVSTGLELAGGTVPDAAYATSGSAAGRVDIALSGIRLLVLDR
jgi:hypothetical protein